MDKLAFPNGVRYREVPLYVSVLPYTVFCLHSPVPPPVQPSIISIKVTSDSITLSWSVDKYVTSSEVKWRETVSDDGVSTKADDNEGTSGRITDTTYTIGGLKSDTEYTITVTVVNPAGSMTSQLITTIENGIKYTAILCSCTAHIVEVKNAGIQMCVTQLLLLHFSNSNTQYIFHCQ